MENKSEVSISSSPQNPPFNRKDHTPSGEVFSDSHFSSTCSVSSTVVYPENSAKSSIISLSQSDFGSSDTESETSDFVLDPIFPIFDPLGCDYPEGDDDVQVSFVTDLFHRSPENGLNPDSSAGLELGSVDSDVDLELGLGLGLGVALPTEKGHNFEGLRVVSVDSESDSEDLVLGNSDGVNDFNGPPLCLNYLGLDNRRNDSGDLGLERVDHTSQSQRGESVAADDDNGGTFFFDGCRNETPIQLNTDVGHREAEEESILLGINQEGEEQEVMIQSDTDEGADFGVEEAIRDLEWEILLAVNNFNREVYDMRLNVDMYESILDEVEDRMDEWKGSPPAARSVIENLPYFHLSQENMEENCVVCAICKNEVSGEEMVRKLPCLHYYHGDCIVPWLKIRNTCPVCRYELPTDDPEYEYRKLEREELIADSAVSLNTQVENSFHMFQ